MIYSKLDTELADDSEAKPSVRRWMGLGMVLFGAISIAISHL